MAQTFEFDDLALGRKSQSRIHVLRVVDDFREKKLGANGEAATPHLFGIAGQFIEVDLRGGNKRADPAAAFNQALLFQGSERVAGGHQADLVNFRKFALRGHRVTRLQIPSVDAFAKLSLDPLIGGDRGALKRHSVFLDSFQNVGFRNIGQNCRRMSRGRLHRHPNCSIAIWEWSLPVL